MNHINKRRTIPVWQRLDKCAPRTRRKKLGTYAELAMKCRICNSLITLGQEYFDNGGMRAHVTCQRRAKENDRINREYPGITKI